jgi:glucosamine-phosphate N-acetyltransferase
MFDIRHLQSDDYYKGYLDLLEQLSSVDKEKISFNDFSLFVGLLNKNHVVYVIEDCGKIIASGTIFIEPKLIHKCGHVGHIEDIIIHMDYEGKSLGHSIIDKLLCYSEDMKCYKVTLDCNNYVKGFYEKCGFEEKGNQMTIYFPIE